MTQPAIPFSAYADGLLEWVAFGITNIFPYAAAITAFAIGVGMVRRWLGHRSAASMGSSPPSGRGTAIQSDFRSMSRRATARKRGEFG